MKFKLFLFSYSLYAMVQIGFGWLGSSTNVVGNILRFLVNPITMFVFIIVVMLLGLMPRTRVKPKQIFAFALVLGFLMLVAFFGSLSGTTLPPMSISETTAQAFAVVLILGNVASLALMRYSYFPTTSEKG